MRTVSALIATTAGLAFAGGCAPMAAEDGSAESASCAGACDGAADVEELLFGERREVGPVGDFGITAEWTHHVELGVEKGARARVVLEPHGIGELPQLTVYRDWGTSVEYVGQSAPGAANIELAAGADDSARYLIEIYGAPEASQGAILELRCVAGDCGPEVEVSLFRQALRGVPSEVREAAGEPWHLFRVSATRERYAGGLSMARIADRLALDAEAVETLAREEAGQDLSLSRASEIDISPVGDYAGGDAALDAFSAFLDPEGGRFDRRYGEARIRYELEGSDGRVAEVVQEIPVLLLVSRGEQSDLAVALDRLALR